MAEDDSAIPQMKLLFLYLQLRLYLSDRCMIVIYSLYIIACTLYESLFLLTTLKYCNFLKSIASGHSIFRSEVFC